MKKVKRRKTRETIKNSGRSRINWKVLILCLIITYAVGFIGSLFTTQNVKTDWYESIKPSITPPGWVIGLVWNILFFLIAISIYFSWIKGDKKKVFVVFGVNLVLNMLWSYFFFSMRSPLAAFGCIIAIWLSVLCIMSYTWKIDKRAFWLIVPYFLWVSFASILNYLSI